MLIVIKEVLVFKLGFIKFEIDLGIYLFVLIYFCVYNVCIIYIYDYFYVFVIFMYLYCIMFRI